MSTRTRFDENSGDQKKLFRASQRLFNHTMDDGLPPNLDSKIFSNDLGKFFVQKIDTIRAQLDTDQHTDSYPEDDNSSVDKTVPPFPTFTMLSVRDVKQLIQNSALKSCPLDPRSSTLVSKCEDLPPVFTTIVNSSLQSECFPEIWKEVLVFPLLKKPGLDVIFKNFRPVSNLSFVSKLIERAAFNQIYGHLVVITYIQLRSLLIEEITALLKVMNDILLNMNKQHVTILVLLDLISAAFDWFEWHCPCLVSILFVWPFPASVCSGTVSDKFDLRYGVPQGLCLGPLLFAVYASALFDVVEKHLPTVHCYADDSQLCISFSPKAHSGQADAVASIEHCIQDIRH